jgi:hypothetical protein
MPRQGERERHSGGIFRETLVDAELEKEGAGLMPQHDSGCDRRIAGAQGDDLALTGPGQRLGGAADEGRIALELDQRRAALSLPDAGFEREKGLGRRRRRPATAPRRRLIAPWSANR